MIAHVRGGMARFKAPQRVEFGELPKTLDRQDPEVRPARPGVGGQGPPHQLTRRRVSRCGEAGGAVKVVIIGTGRMGRGFATALASRHELTVGSRDPDRARKVASATGAARGATYAEAAAGAEVVILTVPWPAVGDALRQLGELDGRWWSHVSYPARKGQEGGAEGQLDRGADPAAAARPGGQGLEPGLRPAPRPWRSTGSPPRSDRRGRPGGQADRVHAGRGHGVPPGRRRPAEGHPRPGAAAGRDAVRAARSAAGPCRGAERAGVPAGGCGRGPWARRAGPRRTARSAWRGGGRRRPSRRRGSSRRRGRP